MFDLIGDIHGHADALKALLVKLGYSKSIDGYRHSERQVIFVGDYIDRGPQIEEVLNIVKDMVASSSAIALMGNHEYNALCFHHLDQNGGHLRKHDIKNIIQHYETLKQFQNKQAEYDNFLSWFMTLPLFYENDLFRAVHACWDTNNINTLKKSLLNGFSEAFLNDSIQKGSLLNDAIDQTLKGKELSLPAGLTFKDKDGNRRDKLRIKWWESPYQQTYNSLSVEEIPSLPEVEISDIDNEIEPYSLSDKPVFFGHYWLRGTPALMKSNVCCLDYSIAKGGHLVAYRFDEESTLSPSKLVFV